MPSKRPPRIGGSWNEVLMWVPFCSRRVCCRCWGSRRGGSLVLGQRSHGHLASQLELVAQLKASEAKYRSIFDNALEGIFQTTPDGRFITANAALARMYGFKQPEELVTKLTDIGSQLYVDPSQRESLLAALKSQDVVSEP